MKMLTNWWAWLLLLGGVLSGCGAEEQMMCYDACGRVFAPTPATTEFSTNARVLGINGKYIVALHDNGRVVSLQMSLEEFNAWNAEQGDSQSVLQQIYGFFKDEFDFIILLSNNEATPEGLYSGEYQGIKNDTKGIGAALFDLTGSYGSAGKLQGRVHLTKLSGILQGPMLHELLHRWGNYVLETSVSAHWGFSSIGGQLGGWKASTLTNLGSNTYQASAGILPFFGVNANGGNTLAYANLELYLMGLVPSSSVEDITVAVNAKYLNVSSGTFTASSLKTVTIAELITQYGARDPAEASSQKSFRALTAVLTPKALTDEEWELVDEHVRQFSLSANDGNAALYNFWEATQGKATIKMDELKQVLK